MTWHIGHLPAPREELRGEDVDIGPQRANTAPAFRQVSSPQHAHQPIFLPPGHSHWWLWLAFHGAMMLSLSKFIPRFPLPGISPICIHSQRSAELLRLWMTRRLNFSEDAKSFYYKSYCSVIYPLQPLCGWGICYKTIVGCGLVRHFLSSFYHDFAKAAARGCGVQAQMRAAVYTSSLCCHWVNNSPFGTTSNVELSNSTLIRTLRNPKQVM